jgi:glycosyltransferase involved in cell wall biosynthesis
LFVHRHGEGNVSGKEGYEEPDWVSWHPWTVDGQHPFASIANPANGISHPIHSYDNPMVSVIIPVGPGHEKEVINALDSLEAQTFKGWEAIVVWDSNLEMPSKFLMDSYPFVIWKQMMPGGNGPGRARNFGTTFARGPLLAFLDADDYYGSEFLRVCVNNFLTHNAIIYTDFVSIIPKESYPQPGMTMIKEREDGNLLVRAYFGDFDLLRAIKRPAGDMPYVWSAVTILVPHVWHKQIGGFDEEMNTWEDCDYLLRLAWHGFVFRKVAEELWIYNFTSGKRRDKAVDNEVELLAYLQMKYDKIADGKVELREQALVDV